ncbi:MFS transporter [Singulisphaera rosea]
MTSGRRVPASYFALFASLYAIQGVVVAYFFSFNQLYMIKYGVTPETASGVQSLALAPFLFKFLFGPLSDRVSLLGMGHRKPYIVSGLLLQSAGLLGLSRVDPGQHAIAFAVVAILTVTGLALYDTCCDGMVIDLTPPEDRARVQGMLVAARAIAAMIGSYGFGLWLEGQGDASRFHSVLYACAGLGLVPLLQILPLSEPSLASDAERFNWSALKAMITPRSLVLLAFGAMYSVVAYGVEINLSPYYQTLGFREGRIGAFASARYVGRAVGAGLLTLAGHRIGRGWIMTLGILALAATTAGQALVDDTPSAAIMGFLFGAANGWGDALFNVLAMEASDPRMAASTYALFMAVSNVSVAGGWIFAKAESSLGGRPSPTFLLSALITLIPLALIPTLSRPTSVREPRDVVA